MSDSKYEKDSDNYGPSRYSRVATSDVERFSRAERQAKLELAGTFLIKTKPTAFKRVRRASCRRQYRPYFSPPVPHAMVAKVPLTAD